MKRGRGRPKLELGRDRDRHLLALALAYRALGMSLRGGCEAAVAPAEGLPVGSLHFCPEPPGQVFAHGTLRR